MSKNLIAKGTKALHVSLIATTLLWSAGIQASAETVTLKDGDLVKATTAPDVYWYSGGKRSPFPNLATFNSWGLSFKNVVKMSQADLNKIDLSGSNVTYRPCTRMIKIQTDPKVYVVAPGSMLHWVKTEEAAKAYFGDMWNKKIDDVADVFFTNYTKGADLADATKAIPGCFLREATSGDTYYINSDGTKSKVDAAGLAANNVNTAHVLTASGTQLSGAAASTAKPTISAADTSLSMYQPKTSGTTPTPPTEPTKSTGTGLTVSLASDTPASTSILANTNNDAQAQIPMLKLMLKASADGDIKVSTLKLKRLGVGSDSDVNNAYLYANGERLAEMQSSASGVLTFVGAPLFTVAKGASLDLWVRMDLAVAATSGKTYGFGLNAATDVDAGSGVTVSGSFPMNGNLMSVATVTDLGRITVANVSPAAAATADAQDGYEAWRFSLQASNQDLLVSKLAMTNTGTTSGDDLQNFKLFDGGTQIGSTVAKMDANKMVTFDLSAAPFKISSGQTKQLTLKLDIKSGANRTFQFSFQKSSDVVAKDNNYGVMLFPFPTGGTAGIWTIVRSHGGAANFTTINAGSVSVSKTADSPSGNIAVNGTSVTLAKYELKGSGEDIKISSLTVTPTVTGNRTLRNLRLYADGTQVGSTVSTAAGATAQTFTLGSSLTIPGGKAKFLTVVADLTGTAVATDSVTIQLTAGNGNGQGILSLTTSNVPGANTNGNALVLAAGSLTAALSSSFSNPTLVRGATNQLIGSLVLTAGTAEGVDVTSITLTDSDANAANALGNALANVKLYQGTTQLGSTFVNPGTAAASTLSFTISPAISIAANGSAQIDIKADILSGATNLGNDNAATLRVSAASGTGKSTSTTVSLAAAQNLQTFTLSNGGTLTVSLDSSTPVDQQVVMASTGNALGSWKFTASQAENLTINQLILVDNSTNNSSLQNVRNLKLYNGATQVGNTVPSLSFVQGSTVFNDNNSTATNIRITDANVSSAHVGKYLVITSGADVGKVVLITAVTTNAGAFDDYTVSAVGAALAAGAALNAATYKIVSGAVFTGINTTINANNFVVLTLKGDVSDVNNASVGMANRFVLGTINGMTGAGTDTVIAQGSSSGQYATLANTNTAYQANSTFPYRTKLTAKANSATPSGTGKVRTGVDTLLKVDLTTNAAYETRIRAAGVFDDMSALGTWTQTNMVAPGQTGTSILGTANGTTRLTEAAGSAVGDRSNKDLNVALNSYNYASFWINSSAAKGAAGDLDFTLGADGASTETYNIPVLGVAAWTYVRINLRAPDDGTDSRDATFDTIGIRVSANVDNNATIDLDDLKFHNDFLIVNVNTSANGLAARASASTLNLVKGNGATAAVGYYHNNNAAAVSASVTFVPTATQGDLIISTSNATETLSLQTDTTALLAAAASVGTNLSLGSSASAVATPGDIVWYDGQATTSVFWTDTQPNPLLGGNLTY